MVLKGYSELKEHDNMHGEGGGLCMLRCYPVRTHKTYHEGKILNVREWVENVDIKRIGGFKRGYYVQCFKGTR